MADQAAESASSKIVSGIEENTSSGNFKMIHSTSQDNNSTLDEYEKEFERVMQEQETLDVYGRDAETGTPDCDTSKGDKQSVSPVTSGESFIPIDCALYALKPIQTTTQCRNNFEQSRNEYSAFPTTSGDESFIPIDCAPCQLNPVQTQSKKNRTLTLGSMSHLTRGGESFFPIDCAPCPLNPVQTPSQGKNSSEPSRNKNNVRAAISGCSSSIQINLEKPPSQTTIKTHTQVLDNSELSRNESSRVDYPPELNPFSDDDETGGGKSTNPFGDSDDDENALTIQEIPPKPRPRHSFSTIKGLEHRYRLPFPLPRKDSKSMPTTPNQSPLLRVKTVNHSFQLPSSSASTYNSIRRKKKPAPQPPNQNHPIPDFLQSPIASPKTNSQPRKTRLAPPPPKPATPTPS